MSQSLPSKSGEFQPNKAAIVLKTNERNYYSFQQSLEIYFPNISPATVRAWLRATGKRTVRANSSERQYFLERGLESRFLISEDDLRELCEHSKSRRSYKKSLLNTALPCSSIPNTSSQHENDLHVFNSGITFDKHSSPNKTNASCKELTVISNDTSTSNASISPAFTNIAIESDTLSITLDTSSNIVHEFDNDIDNSNISHVDASTTPTNLATDSHSDDSHSDTNMIGNNSMHNSSIPSVDTRTTLSNLATGSDTSTTPMHGFLSTGVESDTNVTREEVNIIPENNSNSLHALKSDKIGCLNLNDDKHLHLKSEFDNLKEFYNVTVNPLRGCSAFQPSTMKKFLERVSCFMNFCHVKYHERKLGFELVNDVEIVQAYITYQLEQRKLNCSTVVRTVTALINLAKYVHRGTSENMDSCVELIHLKNVQRQLSQKQHSYQLAVKAGLCDEEKSVFMFQHLLETIKNLRDKLKDLPGDTRTLHDFVLISLYVTCMCGRSKEIRTLELFHELEQGKEFRFNWQVKRNVLVVSANENKFTLYENDFKNLQSHGPSKFEIEESMWLIPYLKEYVNRRKDLLRDNTHPFMFVTATGLPFTSPSFTSYLGKLFEKEVKIRAGTTKLRHALVTHVLSLPESESLNLRESLATLMRHSLKHQQFTYCDTSRQDKTSLSRDLLNKSIEEVTNTETSSSSPAVIPKGDNACSVKVGDMVALVDGATTCIQDASIFLARVVRLSPDETVALLMEFRRLPGEKSLYRAVVDSSWYESTNSLVFPIDVIYNRQREAYELRSSVAEIYNAVFPNRLDFIAMKPQYFVSLQVSSDLLQFHTVLGKYTREVQFF